MSHPHYIPEPDTPTAVKKVASRYPETVAIILSIIFTGIGGTWVIAKTRADDLLRIQTDRLEDLQRTTKLESIVTGHDEQVRILTKTQGEVSQNLAILKILLEKHIEYTEPASLLQDRIRTTSPKDNNP